MNEKTGADEHTVCNKRLEYAMLQNKTIHKLVDAISGLGCTLPNDFIICRRCPDGISGGFAIPSPSIPYKPQVILCENHKLERETFENTIVHELVHAYDLCRTKLDWSNCVHHACTEIRASSLSGECSLLHELFRGHLVISKGHQECVQRRSELSVKMNQACTSKAAEYVRVAFPECYHDQKPFNADNS